MSETVLRTPINHEARHMSSKTMGIWSNYNNQAHPQGLFSYRQEWSLKGIFRQDLDEISDLQPYVVIQNPTPFGYYVKQAQYLKSTGQNGQPSSLVPRVPLQMEPIVHKSLPANAMFSALRPARDLIDRDPGPKGGPVVMGDMGNTSQLSQVQGLAPPAFIPSMKGTFKRAAESMVPENRPSKINKRFGTFIQQNQQKQEYDRERATIKRESSSNNVLTNYSVNPDKLNNM